MPQKQSAIDHNFLVMKIYKLINTLEPVENYHLSRLRKGFNQIQLVTHFKEESEQQENQKSESEKVQQQVQIIADQIVYEPEIELESSTEKAMNNYGIGLFVESQLSNNTRLLADEIVLKGVENIPTKYVEPIETPIAMSVDSRKSYTAKESDQTKNVQIRKNVLEKDPYVQYQESKKLRVPEETQSMI